MKLQVGSIGDNWANVWLDDAPQKLCTQLDTESGTLVRYVCDEKGKVIWNESTGKSEVETVSGKIRVEFWDAPAKAQRAIMLEYGDEAVFRTTELPNANL